MVAKWEMATETLHRIWKQGADVSDLGAPFQPLLGLFHPTETLNPQVPSTLGWTAPFLGLPQKEFDSIMVKGRGQVGFMGALCQTCKPPQPQHSL